MPKDNKMMVKGELSRFAYQENQFWGECNPCTPEVFNRLIDDPQVAWKINTRRAVEQSIREGRPLDSFVQSADFQKFCQQQEKKVKNFLQLTEEQKLQQWTNSLKMSLQCFIFGVNGFQPTMVKDKDGQGEHPFCRRKQENIKALSGFFMLDLDHLHLSPKELFERTRAEGFPWKILFAHKTSSGEGLRLVCEARPSVGNISDCQLQLASDLGVLDMMGTTGSFVVDNSCIDATRISYCPCREDIYFMDEELLFAPQEVQADGFLNEFDRKYREDYRQGKTQPTNSAHSFSTAPQQLPEVKAESTPEPTTISQVASTDSQPMKFGHPIVDFVHALLPSGAPVGSRHEWMLKVYTDLLILCDNNDAAARSVIKTLPWVQAVIAERGEQELENIIDSAKKRNRKRESENLYPLQPSVAMRRAIEQVTRRKYKELVRDLNNQATGHTEGVPADEASRLLEIFGKEIQKMMPHYPLLKLLCHRLKRKHFVAAMFLGGAFMTTLMTRCWYRFWSEPGRRCRLNSILELIGRSGSGKHVAVDLYNLLMAPVKKADAPQLEALNKWNEEKEQKSGADKNKTPRPKGILRCLPAESSAAAIREAEFNAKEEIDGEEWPLHVFQFNSELDDLLSQQKKDYMNIDVLFLKSLHNEPTGTLLKTTSSVAGEYNVHFNGVYTGTSDALNKQATTSNFARGLLARLTVIPMGDSNFEMREYREYTDEDKLRDEQLRQWAYNMDKTKGEIPCSDLSKALHKWTEAQMNDAKEEDSKALEDLVKRPCWHAINYALPFIVSRHWDQMVEDEDGYMKCGPGFATDHVDRKLTLLLAKAQLAFQKYFFLAVGEQLYENLQMQSVTGHQTTQRLQLAYKRLPAVFTSADVAREYGYDSQGSISSRLKRLQDDGLAQKIRTGEDKGKYRKLA